MPRQPERTFGVEGQVVQALAASVGATLEVWGTPRGQSYAQA